MPPVTPMRLLRIREPFDHPDFIFEPKLDGFRALAHVHGHRCELVSSNGHTFKRWPQLARRSRTRSGRITRCSTERFAASNRTVGPTSTKLLFRREWPHFYAFDVLSIEGEDLTALPLVERKRRLLAVMPTIDCRLLYAR